MSAQWVWFWIIMAILSPVWVLVLYVIIDWLVEVAKSHRTKGDT